MTDTAPRKSQSSAKVSDSTSTEIPTLWSPRSGAIATVTRLRSVTPAVSFAFNARTADGINQWCCAPRASTPLSGATIPANNPSQTLMSPAHRQLSPR